MVVKKVSEKYKFLGKSNVGLEHGSVYDCIGIIDEEFQRGFLQIVDESGEAYIYSPKAFDCSSSKLLISTSKTLPSKPALRKLNC